MISCPMCGTIMPLWWKKSLSKDVRICDGCSFLEIMADCCIDTDLPRHCYSDRFTDHTVMIARG